jgi:hypothetical protein
MSREEFGKVTSQRKLKIEYPFDDTTPAVNIGDTQYSFAFCNGRIASISWMLDDNKTYLASLNQKINTEGFRISETLVSRRFSDATNDDLAQLELTLERDDGATPYYVRFFLFDINGQIDLIDKAYPRASNEPLCADAETRPSAGAPGAGATKEGRAVP